MGRIFSIGVVVFFLSSSAGAFAQGDAANCCFDCSCTLCGDQLSCANSPFVPSDCAPGGLFNCGEGTPTPCTFWWENSNLTGADRGDGASSDCIPIDGGLGFLIAGGLGMGVIGIRRRKDGMALKCA